jgi:hypothetical protein
MKNDFQIKMLCIYMNIMSTGSRCQAKTLKGTQCSRKATKGKFCTQHSIQQKSVATPTATSISVPVPIDQLGQLDDPAVEEICRQLMAEGRFNEVAALSRSKKRFNKICQPMLQSAKPQDPPPSDFDKLYPIPP